MLVKIDRILFKHGIEWIFSKDGSKNCEIRNINLGFLDYNVDYENSAFLKVFLPKMVNSRDLKWSSRGPLFCPSHRRNRFCVSRKFTGGIFCVVLWFYFPPNLTIQRRTQKKFYFHISHSQIMCFLSTRRNKFYIHQYIQRKDPKKYFIFSFTIHIFHSQFFLSTHKNKFYIQKKSGFFSTCAVYGRIKKNLAKKII